MSTAAHPLTNFSELNDDVLMTEQQAAAVLGCTAGSLANRRCRRQPVADFIRMPGAGIRYRVGAIRAAIASARNNHS